jgi:phospholipid/cholesterol/gamma-HCH transport system substrate-binding protein
MDGYRMKQQTKIEIWVGLFVLMAIIALTFIALKVSNFSSIQDRPAYQISAKFSDIGGLKVRAPVKVSGVVVGRVSNIFLDKQTFQAQVNMDIYKEYSDLPIDTSASILTSGLLGDQYIGLTPGAEEEVLQPGDQITMTQSALVLENLIGQFLVKLSDKGSK